MKRFIVALFLICISFPLIFPYLRSGFFVTHDGEWAVIRAVEMHRELKDLQIPPRWAGFLNHGYGYPLFLFTYPFPYYLTEVFHLFHLGFVDSTKAIFVVSIMLSAFAMYFLGEYWWGMWGGIIGATLYLYGPFRLVDLFVRGSIGESLGFVWLPLIVLFGIKNIRETKIYNRILFSIFITFLILSHNAFALLSLPVVALLLFVLVCSSEKKHVVKKLIVLSILGLSGFGIAAYFFLPALFEQRFTLLSTGILTHVVDQFSTFGQLFGITNDHSRFALQIGTAHIIILLLSCIVAFRKKILSHERAVVWVSIGMALLLIYLVTPQSAWFWNTVPVFSSIDFAWRYLGPLLFLVSFVGGVLGKTIKSPVIITIVIVFIIAVNMSLIKPGELINRGDAFYETNDATTTAFDELMPVWIKEKARNFYTNKIEIISGEGTVVVSENRSQRLRFNAAMSKDSFIGVNTLYFPGWRVIIDRKEIPISLQQNRGTIEFVIPQGMHDVIVQFTNTPIRTVGETISFLSLVILGLVTITLKKQKL